MNRPLQNFKARGISIAAWGDASGRITYSLEKKYHDKRDGTWKVTNKYFPEELTQLKELLQTVEKWRKENKNGVSAPKNDTMRVDPIFENDDDLDIPF